MGEMYVSCKVNCWSLLALIPLKLTMKELRSKKMWHCHSLQQSVLDKKQEISRSVKNRLVLNIKRQMQSNNHSLTRCTVWIQEYFSLCPAGKHSAVYVEDCGIKAVTGSYLRGDTLKSLPLLISGWVEQKSCSVERELCSYQDHRNVKDVFHPPSLAKANPQDRYSENTLYPFPQDETDMYVHSWQTSCLPLETSKPQFIKEKAPECFFCSSFDWPVELILSVLMHLRIPWRISTRCQIPQPPRLSQALRYS